MNDIFSPDPCTETIISHNSLCFKSSYIYFNELRLSIYFKAK